jgi:hypothetical protein
VIGDVDPPEVVLVVTLVLTEPGRAVAVVTEDHACVVQGHPGDGVRPAASASWTGAPGIAAQQDS